MSYAYKGRILRVNLSRSEIIKEDINSGMARKFIGGSGLATRYFYDLAPNGVDPLGVENPLIFMTGPLTGTPSASASRYSVVAKSPLTGIWGAANSGGTFGPALKFSGFDGIIFEGASPDPVYLQIDGGNAQLKDASDLWGRTVTESDEILRERLGGPTTVACIGPAGENLVRYAAIMNDRHRAAGRCGLGAVMGSKRLKAIACSGRSPIDLAEPYKFQDANKRQRQYIDDSLLKIGFDTFGTNMIADMVNVRGGYPTRNWTKGTFESIEEVNAQAVTDSILVKGTSCYACPVICGRKTEIREGKWKGNKGEGPEYESINTLGALCGIEDLQTISMANYRCNDYGLDTISAGGTIAFAMECFERGILTKEAAGGLEIRFGDGDLLVDLIEKIARREGVGDLLAMGSLKMAQELGNGSQHYAVQVKGLELPAYDPRAAKISGLAYVTANRGGDHMTGYIQGPTFIDIPFLIVEESSIRDPFTADPQEVKVLVDMENALTVLDALGGCKFMGVLLSDADIAELVATATGWDFSVGEFRQSGDRIYNLVRAYNAREGMRREQDILPGRLMEDPLPDGPARGMTIDDRTMEMLKDAYYELRGWDTTSGIPTPQKLQQLELESISADLWPPDPRR